MQDPAHGVCRKTSWRSGKVFRTDPVHGDVYLTELEMRVVASRPFQRLRRVRQLGDNASGVSRCDAHAVCPFTRSRCKRFKTCSTEP